jgi:hypothetical protein
MFGWLKRRAEDLFGRSGQWPRVRREHLEQEPSCIACGRSRELEVHHVQPYHEHPELELDSQNLVSLCADPCHFVFGHLLNWRRSNPHVREDAARYRERMRVYGSPDSPDGSSAGT